MPPPLLNRQTSSPPTLSVQHTLNSGVFIQNALSICLPSLPSFKGLLKITPLPPYLSHIPGKYVIFFLIGSTKFIQHLQFTLHSLLIQQNSHVLWFCISVKVSVCSRCICVCMSFDFCVHVSYQFHIVTPTSAFFFNAGAITLLCIQLLLLNIYF